MIIVHDSMCRKYRVIDVCPLTTLLQCLKTNDHIRIRNTGWNEMGFFIS